jgi:FkbM family methyltransferase
MNNFQNWLRYCGHKLFQKIRSKLFWFLVRHNSIFRIYSFFTNHKKSFAINEIDVFISKLFAEVKSPKFYIELGANDGISQSNTKYLELYDGWNGVLIEPIPELFNKLIKNRSSSNIFVNSACCSFNYSNASMTFLYANLMSISLDGKSDIRDRQQHAVIGSAHLNKGESSYELQVPATTLNSILLENDAPKRINFFSLDVEGSELEVLEGIDYDEFVFEFICVETRDFHQIRKFLQDRGYDYFAQLTNNLSHSDYLFKYQKREV